jgi:hypothetical protein
MTDDTVILPIKITVRPYLQDHRFEGNAVFPAVEAMQVLARTVKEFAPRTDITASTGIKFDKFLFIPPGTKKLDALCHITPFENGDVTAVLQTKFRSKTAAFTRTKEHVTVHFPRMKPEVNTGPGNSLRFGETDYLEISPDQIYRELVPFGPAYHNILPNLAIHKDGALARIQAPKIDDPVEKNTLLGSPFVLDAAFHAACVWGQRYSKIVAFPVAVDRRIIVKPTRPGDAYRCRIIPTGMNSDLLVFDIFIYDEDNALYESAMGVHMRDVSAGRMKPSAWIIETDGKG